MVTFVSDGNVGSPKLMKPFKWFCCVNPTHQFFATVMMAQLKLSRFNASALNKQFHDQIRQIELNFVYLWFSNYIVYSIITGLFVLLVTQITNEMCFDWEFWKVTDENRKRQIMLITVDWLQFVTHLSHVWNGKWSCKQCIICVKLQDNNPRKYLHSHQNRISATHRSYWPEKASKWINNFIRLLAYDIFINRLWPIVNIQFNVDCRILNAIHRNTLD